MKKLSALLVLFAFLFSQTADALIINSLPYNLTNGSLADATQVMANYNQIVNNVNTNAAHNGANSDITSLTGLTTPLANTYGGTVIYTGGTTAGTANVQTLATVTPSSYANTAGNIVTAIAGVSNSGAMTLAVNSQTAKAVDVENGGGLSALVGGETVAGNSYTWMYDGTEFILLNPSIIQGSNIVSSVALAGSPITTTQSAADSSTKIATTGFVNGTALTLTSGSTASTQAVSDNSTKVATTAYVNTYFPETTITNTLSGDVTMTNGSQFYDGPVIAQGTSGTWLVIGAIVLNNAANANYSVKLWDGTTVFSSTQTGMTTSAGAGNNTTVTVAAIVTAPAASLKISASCSTTGGTIKFNASGSSKDSQLQAIRIR